MSIARTVKPLTPAEREQYEQDCNTVFRTKDSFIECGTALHRIRDKKTYREDAVTFEELCQTKFGFTRQRALQLIAAAKTDAKMTTMVVKPQSERQLRELAKDPEPAEAWEAAKEETGKEQPTAKEVKATVEKRKVVEPKASIVLDDLNRAVPEHLTEHHEAAVHISTAATRFDAITKAIRELSETPGGAFIACSELLVDISKVKKRLKDSRYYTECPACAGEIPASSCRRCKGAGFIPHSMKGVLSADEKEWLGA